jgi:hypothetical protein
MKKSFIQMVNKHGNGNYPMDWFYRYFTEKSNSRLDPNIFSQIFISRNLDETLAHVAKELGVGIVYKGDKIVAAFEL